MSDLCFLLVMMMQTSPSVLNLIYCEIEIEHCFPFSHLLLDSCRDLMSQWGSTDEVHGSQSVGLGSVSVFIIASRRWLRLLQLSSKREVCWWAGKERSWVEFWVPVNMLHTPAILPKGSNGWV